MAPRKSVIPDKQIVAQLNLAPEEHVRHPRAKDGFGRRTILVSNRGRTWEKRVPGGWTVAEYRRGADGAWRTYVRGQWHLTRELVYRVWRGKVGAGQQVRCRDGDEDNLRPSNLRLTSDVYWGLSRGDAKARAGEADGARAWRSWGDYHVSDWGEIRQGDAPAAVRWDDDWYLGDVPVREVAARVWLLDGAELPADIRVCYRRPPVGQRVCLHVDNLMLRTVHYTPVRWREYTTDDAAEVRRLWAAGVYDVVALAREFETDRRTIEQTLAHTGQAARPVRSTRARFRSPTVRRWREAWVAGELELGELLDESGLTLRQARALLTGESYRGRQYQPEDPHWRERAGDQWAPAIAQMTQGVRAALIPLLEKATHRRLPLEVAARRMASQGWSRPVVGAVAQHYRRPVQFARGRYLASWSLPGQGTVVGITTNDTPWKASEKDE